MRYERFTDRAKRVMQFATKFAKQLDHEYIGTEHVLLGLIEEGAGIAAGVLRDVSDLATLRQQVLGDLLRGEPIVTMGMLPTTPRVKRALELARQAADSFDHPYLNTEHILLGLVREKESFASVFLEQQGITEELVYAKIVYLLGEPKEASVHKTIVNVTRLLIYCDDSLVAVAGDRDADLIAALDGTRQAIRWINEYRAKQIKDKDK